MSQNKNSKKNTIGNASRILYVDKGKIQESGSHEELLKNHGPYYNLFMSQYSFMNDKVQDDFPEENFPEASYT